MQFNNFYFLPKYNNKTYFKSSEHYKHFVKK